MSRFVRYVTCLFTFVFIANAAVAAGYTCSTKTYTSCSANYYLSSGQCKSCPSGYPYSAGGTGGITSCYSKSKSRAWTGSQVNGSTPTNCYSVTSWNSCSGSACSYVAYSNSAGTGDGTIKSGCSSNSANCTKTANTTTGKSGYYGYSGGNGGACSSCSSFDSTRTLSDNGNTGSGYCYKNVTKTGSQVNGSTPTNCYSVTSWNSCSPGTCTYKDYYSATDTTCTPSNCTKTANTTTGKSGYYGYSGGNGGACSACSSFSSTYTKSDDGATSSAYCYKDAQTCGSQQEPSAIDGCASSTVGTCTVGCCTYKDYYSATDTTCSTWSNCTKPRTCNSCSANRYLNSNKCPTCSSFNSSYPYSAAGTTSSNYCYKMSLKYGGRVDAGVPANCKSATYTQCTLKSCEYVDYYNATDGTCSVENCVNPVATVTAKSGYYDADTTCPACSSVGDGSYTLSKDGNDGGNTKCYKNVTLTGAQNNPSLPANCSKQEYKSSCTPGQCTYEDYYNVSDTACTPAACTKERTKLYAKSTYYVNGTTSCLACNTVGDKSYTASAADNTGGSGQCYKNCSTPCTQPTANCPANATCTYGDTSTSGQHYYGSDQCNAEATICDIVDYLCNSGYNKTFSGACALTCTGGVTTLRTGTGVIVPLYAEKLTTPAINIRTTGGEMCYANLSEGSGTGAINVKYNDVTYHTVQ